MTASMLGAEVKFTLVPEGDAADAPSFIGVGRLGFISPEVDPVTRQVRIWAELDNRELQLRPGQQGRLTLPIPEE
jgi:macrolide-specific efflux system membrane fusion protein